MDRGHYGMRRTVPLALLERIARARNPGVLLRALVGTARQEGGTMQVEVIRYQLPLWIIDKAPTKGRLRECDQVVCRLGCLLFAARCVDRQAARWRSGDRRGKPKFYECQGCALGEGYRARLAGYQPPEDSDTREVMSPSQRAAKAKARATRIDPEEPNACPLAEAAALTPDDRQLP